MIKRQRASSSSLFLMELILAILLFCIAATICISVFARSHLLHKQSGEQNAAINIVQNTAEIIRSENTEKDIINGLNAAYTSIDFDNLNQSLTIGFDESFTESNTPENSSYQLVIDSEYTDGLYGFNITMFKTTEETPIYNLFIERTVY